MRTELDRSKPKEEMVITLKSVANKINIMKRRRLLRGTRSTERYPDYAGKKTKWNG